KNRLNQTSTSHQHPVLRTRPTRSFVLANCPDYLFLPLQRVLYEPPRQRRQTTLSVTVLVLQLHDIFPLQPSLISRTLLRTRRTDHDCAICHRCLRIAAHGLTTDEARCHALLRLHTGIIRVHPRHRTTSSGSPEHPLVRREVVQVVHPNN